MVKLIFVILIISFGGFGLSPDEAQYWTWSRALDFGYYSKPPAIAWQIALTTSIFGNTVLGIRMGAIILSFCLPLAIFRLVKGGGGSQSLAFSSALCVAFSPFGIFYSFPATTDLGMILFLTLAMHAVIRGPHYLLAGAFILLAALYKWTAYSFWGVVLVFSFLYPYFKKKQLLMGILISLLALLPSLWWNFVHDFATFRHVGRTLSNSNAGGNFFDFLGGQIGLISPVYFVFFILGVYSLWKRWKDKEFFIVFTAAFASLFFIFLIFSIFKKIQPNWPFFLYPSLLIIVAYSAKLYLKGSFWLKTGTFLSIFFSLASLAIPYVQNHKLLNIPYSLNPFRQILGWEKLIPALKEVGYGHETDFLFGDKYQISSLLSYYSEGKKRAYFFNLSDQRKNQFSYWPSLAEEAQGKTGYFVAVENGNYENSKTAYEAHYLKMLAPYFSTVELAGAYPLFESGNQIVKFAFIFRCKEYNGKSPLENTKY